MIKLQGFKKLLHAYMGPQLLTTLDFTRKLFILSFSSSSYRVLRIVIAWLPLFAALCYSRRPHECSRVRGSNSIKFPPSDPRSTTHLKDDLEGLAKSVSKAAPTTNRLRTLPFPTPINSAVHLLF